MPLLDNPHHDGSPVYVRLSDESREVPTLGSVVALRMASNPADPIDAVWIRTTYDAELTFHPCTRGDDGSRRTQPSPVCAATNPGAASDGPVLTIHAL